MSCIKDLNDAAMVESNPDKRQLLKAAAANLRSAIAEFCTSPTLEYMIELNGAWAFAAKVMRTANTPEPTPPQAGSPEVRERKAA